MGEEDAEEDIFELGENVSQLLKKQRTHGSKIYQGFDLGVSQLKLNGLKKVPMDVLTRWNSTYEMLEAALPLRDAFARLDLIDKNYDHNPSDEEWEIAMIIFSVVLDPRCDLAVVEFYYEQVYGPYESASYIDSGKYPTLARLAHDILVVLVTTVALEAAFSVGGRVIDESCASLLPDIVEALMTANDWIESPKKISVVYSGVARPKDDFDIIDEASSMRGGGGGVSFCFGVSVGSADYDYRVCI
ncbi:hypothetical protein RHSIM_Rhsim01G0175300 [Rhododendron simsii]|uniref:HAT C-terminal dimerisation domain-containing protein n=1 Tax=Rhododendron simsii TaxID=118357 RepID=A0A834HKI2_RHOSS|nr:hypothetical protein RHSIM_Rhsim01G0175300 [Rhododendron simsii]